MYPKERNYIVFIYLIKLMIVNFIINSINKNLHANRFDSYVEEHITEHLVFRVDINPTKSSKENL